MEEELKEVLRSYQQTLAVLSQQPVTAETCQARAELEEAIERTLEVLRELETLTDDDTMQTEPPLDTPSGQTWLSQALDWDGDAGDEETSRKRRHQATSQPSHLSQALMTELVDSPADFAKLQEKYPTFRSHTWRARDGSYSMDFSDPVATLELTKALLKEYYGLEWEIPLGQLVPAVPCRAKPPKSISPFLRRHPRGAFVGEPVVGLDVGCGANCIYSLLGATMYGWRFVGSDVTDVAVHWARDNVYRNPRIRNLIEIVKLPEGTEEILAPVVSQHGPFHFTICNPPFFTSLEEAGSNPKTAFGGTAAEMVYPGGEYGFVEKMVDESVQLGDQVTWYSAMLGKKATFKAVRSKLYSLDVAALRTTTLQQGKMTRWAIAWSFSARNTNDKPLRPSSHIKLPTALTFPVHDRNVEALMSCMRATFQAYIGWSTVPLSSTDLSVRHGETSCTLHIDESVVGQFTVSLHGSSSEELMKILSDVEIIWRPQ